MARVSLRFASFLMVFVASLLCFTPSFLLATAFQFPGEFLPENLTGAAVSAVLPLFWSGTNSSLHRHALAADSNRRRLLSTKGRSAEARMRLYDGLLGNGYYSTRLFIGTPPQKFALIVDTGSTVTYVPCSSCRKCGKHQDPRFKPELSRSYQQLKCHQNCKCDKGGKICTYERRYAEKSSTSGILGEDIISFGDESTLVPQRAVFGCENVETGDLYGQDADGIMGLGRGRLSVVDQLVHKGAISDSFSLCYGGMGVGGGGMVLGAFHPPPDMVFSHYNPHRSPYYNIALKEIHVGGKALQLDQTIFNRKHGTVLDSGTTYAYIPEMAFLAFKCEIQKKIHLKRIRGPDHNYNDICFSGAGRHASELSRSFPEVDMVFSNGQKFSLSPENYLFRHATVPGAYCLGIFPNGKDPTTLLGGIIVRNTLVTYDRGNKRIGFWKTNCSELWKEKHLPVASSPAPVNKTNQKPPALASSASPSIAIPGNCQIGQITFDISLSVKKSSRRPNFTEFAEFIAHELEVDTSQIHVLNVTSKEKIYLVSFAVYPAKSAVYISNTTAVSIILQLTEHRMKLPQIYEGYQLVEWKVEPTAKKAWREKHFLEIAVGFVLTLVLGALAFNTLLAWRRQYLLLNSYKLVDRSAAEQELQPL